jgi:hypothetical protein
MENGNKIERLNFFGSEDAAATPGGGWKTEIGLNDSTFSAARTLPPLLGADGKRK